MKPFRSPFTKNSVPVRVLTHLRRLAEDGQVCPTNREIADALGTYQTAVTGSLTALKEIGVIETERAGNRRIVKLVQHGLETADPCGPQFVIRRPTILSICEAASETFYVAVPKIRSRSRSTQIVRARHAVCLVASARGHQSTVIGRVLDRDHSTVLHAVKRAHALRSRNPDFAAQLADLERQVPLPERVQV